MRAFAAPRAGPGGPRMQAAVESSEVQTLLAKNRATVGPLPAIHFRGSTIEGGTKSVCTRLVVA